MTFSNSVRRFLIFLTRLFPYFHSALACPLAVCSMWKKNPVRSALILSSVLLHLAVTGQTFYKTLGSSNANEIAQCVQALADGNYAVGGSRGDSALIIKVDPLGNVLWSRCFKPVPGVQNLIYQIAATPDGYLIGTGSAAPLTSLYGKTFLFKFDLAGNMIWQSHSSGSKPIWTHRVLPLSATQYMAMSEVYDVSSPTWSDPCIALVNANTGVLDSNKPRLNFFSTTPYIDDINSATLSPSLAVYGYGRTYISGSPPSSMRPFITKFDQTGQHLWTKYLMYSSAKNARIYGSDITYADDSLITSYFGNITGTATNFSVGLIRTDTAGNVAWTKDYKLQGYTSAKSFKVLRMPYGFAITGYCISGTHRDLFVIATDRKGQVIWAKTYGPTNSSSDLSVDFTEQSVAIGSGIMFTGTAYSPGDTNIILARIDSAGNISCGTSTSINIIQTSVPPYSMVIAPTQIPDLLTFVAPTSLTSEPSLNELCASVQLNLGPDIASCEPTTLSAAMPNATYLWSTGSTSSSITVSGPDTVWVEVTAGCCTYADTIVISDGTLGTASFNFSSSPCDLEITPVNLSTNASSYEWDFGDGGTSVEDQPTHTYAASGTYDIALTAINGCGSNDTTIQLVIFRPGTFSINGPDTLCAGQDGTYSFSLSGGSLANITWSSGAESDTILYAPMSSGILFANATDSNSCVYSDTISLHINPAPQAAFTFPTSSCDSVITFSDGSINTNTWQWDLGNGESSTIPSPIGHYPSAGTFIVQLIVSNACGSDTVSHALTLGANGVLELIGPDSICAGDSGVYSILLQGTGVSNVLWSLSSGDSTSIALNLLNSSMLEVTVLGSDGCTYVDSLAIQVAPLPYAAFTVLVDPCDSNAAFQNASLYANSYTWDFGNGETSNAVSPTVQFSPMVYDVTLIASNSCGVDVEQQSVEVEQIMTIELIGPRIICSDRPVTFHISYSGIGLHDIVWSTGDNTSSITIGTLDRDTIHVSALDNHGCLLHSSFLVEHVDYDGLGGTVAPNVFTPNKDGINDYFKTTILDGFISMTILNRWGTQIYETTDISKPWRGDLNGSPVPDGTYFYIVKWNDMCTETPAEAIGHVTLIR